MQDVRLTPTSYVVLGLIDQVGQATPYDLKRLVSISVGYFWSLQHAQLYSEPERLTRAGYLTEEREEGGRRRKRYALTERGREALAAWRAQPPDDLAELREPALLKLFFGADRKELATAQLEAHRRRLAEYEAVREQMPPRTPEGSRLTLEAGIRHQHTWIAFWREVARG